MLIIQKDYKDGWNAALEEVIEYLRSGYEGEALVSKSGLIGHCEASKKPKRSRFTIRNKNNSYNRND